MTFAQTPIGKKQVVAVTGLLMISFILVHLAGNFFLFAGPGAFNGYAHKLSSLRPALYGLELVLLAGLAVHFWLTFLIIHENIQARGGLRRYAVERVKGERSLAARLMPFTGTAILAFIVWHLLDFTFTDHEGVRSLLPDGQSYGLYGVVYNAFSQPSHSALYILAVSALGFHLTHGIQSLFQTFGLDHPVWTPRVRRMSQSLGTLVALGYSSIPVYVLIRNLLG